MSGKEFRIKRAILGMTQAELANELDIQANTVSRYETEDLKIPRTVELALEALERRQQDADSKEN